MSRWPRFLRKKPTDAAERLYHAVVGQARQPDFYLNCGVPDTVDGRFDMIALHAFVVMRRLGGTGEDNDRLAQAMFDEMFADMDRNLREMGAGDLSMGRKIKQLVEVFYGRIRAYDEGLGEGQDKLAEALRRNLFRKTTPDDGQVGEMARYLRREVASSLHWDLAALRRGDLSFGPPPRRDGKTGKTAAGAAG